MTEIDWTTRINKIRGAGFTLKGVERQTGLPVSQLYKLAAGEKIRTTPEVWTSLDEFYRSLTTAGVIK